MNIQHADTAGGGGGEFFLEEQRERVAEMTYTRESPTHVTIRHTGVSDRLAGRGVGRALVEAAVRWARVGGVKIDPVCSFARSVFDKTPAFADVRA